MPVIDIDKYRSSPADYTIEDIIGRKDGVSIKFNEDPEFSSDEYTPVITTYYGSDDNIVRVEEVFRGSMWSQTISGSIYVQNWPDYTYTEIFNSWEDTTVS